MWKWICWFKKISLMHCTLQCTIAMSLIQITELWMYCNSQDVHSCPSYMDGFSCAPDATALVWPHYHDYLAQLESKAAWAKHTRCQYLPLFHLKQFFFYTPQSCLVPLRSAVLLRTFLLKLERMLHFYEKHCKRHFVQSWQISLFWFLHNILDFSAK